MHKNRLENNSNLNYSDTAITLKSFKRKRIINFRAFLLIALFLLCTVFSALLSTVFKWFGITLFVLIITAVIVLILIYRKNTLKRLTFIICACCCVFSFSAFLITDGMWIKEIDYSKTVSVVGLVESDVSVDGIRKIYLKDVSFNGESVSGQILLYVSSVNKEIDDAKVATDINSSGFESGTVISISCRVFSERLTESFYANGNAFRENRRYTATVADSDITLIGKHDPGLFIKIREFIKDKLVKGLGEEYGALSYGMITGDKAYLSLITRNYFSAAGLVHILAVSGLHLGFLTAVLTFILKKAKAARWVTAAITLAVLFFYAFIAGFSPSVLRAVIMSAVGLLVFLFGKRGDTLNTLSFAFCLIITFMPFYLFEAGFILSVCCVYGIALFYLPFYKGLKKIKFPKYAAAAVAVSASIQLGFIPAVIFLFNNVQLYGFIANVFMLPVISLCFMLAVICLILTSVIPPAVFAFKPVFWGFKALDFVAYNVANLPYARIIVYSLPAIFIIYALYFMCSRYFMVRRKWIIWIVTLVFSVSLIAADNPVVVDKSSITPLYNGYSALTYITENGKGYLVGDIWSGYFALDKLKRLRVRRLDAIFALNMDSKTAYQIQVMNGFFTGFTLYYPEFTESRKPEESNSVLEIKEQQEKDATAAQLRNIKNLSFASAGEILEEIEIVPLFESFAAVFADGKFAAYEFCPDTKNINGIKTNVLLPKTYFKYDKWYDEPQTVDRYNIICSYYYRPLGSKPEDKLYLINGETEGENIYSLSKRNFSYNYLSFEFVYDLDVKFNFLLLLLWKTLFGGI